MRLLLYYYLSINFMAASSCRVRPPARSATRSSVQGVAPSPLLRPASLQTHQYSSPLVSPWLCRVVRSTIRVATRGWVFQTTERHLGPLWAAHNLRQRTGAYPEYSLMVAPWTRSVRSSAVAGPNGSKSERLGSCGTPMARCCCRIGPMAASVRWKVCTSKVGYHPVSLPAPVGTVDLASREPSVTCRTPT